MITDLNNSARQVLGKMASLAINGGFVAVAIVIFNLFKWTFRPEDLTSYVFEAYGIIFVGAGVDRIWDVTIKGMLRNPSSWFAVSTRIPFWFMAGGMGYVMGLLFSKKFGWLDFYEVPVMPLFAFGAWLGIGVLGIPHIIRRLSKQSLVKTSFPR